MKIIISVVLILLLNNQLFSDVVFDVTFDGDSFVSGESCPTGEPPEYPQYEEGLGGSRIEYSAAFNSKAADLGWLLFDPGVSYSSGIHTLSWTFWSEKFGEPTGWPSLVVTLEDSSIFIPNGRFSVDGHSYGYSKFAYGEVINYTAIVNLDNDTTSFYANDTQYVTNAMLAEHSTLSAVIMQNPSHDNTMLDDFSWVVVPEPSAMLLLVGGGSLLLAWRRKRKQVG